MQITNIFSFLVLPEKNKENPKNSTGVELRLEGNLFGMLSDVFTRSDLECDIPIRFLKDDDGNQNNEVRNMLIAFVQNPGVEEGMIIADRLRDYSTGKSGLGLLFLMTGELNDTGEKKLIISRFPADRGILAERVGEGLQVQFIERVFLKSATSYKAALYRDTSLDAGFWSGFAVDKQINMPGYQIANYWIKDFLHSDFKTTSKAGTKRFAVAIREASKKAPSLEIQQELIGLRLLVGGLRGQVVSIEGVMNNFGLSDYAAKAIEEQLTHSGLLSDQFILDQDEFNHYAAFTSIELNTGGVLLAPSEKFNKVFQKVTIDEQQNIHQFIAEGRIIDERIKGRK